MTNTAASIGARKESPDGFSDDLDVHERAAFDRLIRSDDSYADKGIYWADLPPGQRVRFVTSTNAAETRSEFAWLWNMFKTDPLKPVAHYLKNAVLPGAGLGLEG